MPVRCLILSLLLPLAAAQTAPYTLSSPNGQVSMRFEPSKQGQWQYQVSFKGQPVITPSRLGLAIQGQPPLGANLAVLAAKPGSLDETYTMPHGKANPLRNRCNTLTLELEEQSGLRRRLTVDARAFDDGAAFRYIIPQQTSIRELRLQAELTEFTFAREGPAFPLILDGYRTSYEDSYVELPLTSIKPASLVALPFLAEVPGVAWAAITEAHLENYAGLYLKRARARIFEASLAPRLDDATLAVTGATPIQSSWRVILLGPTPGSLAESNIVLHLSPPSRIADTSWIKPGKTSWSWWSGDFAKDVSFEPGMNTETMKHYIDFSAANGLEYVLLDEGWSGDVAGRARDLTRANPAIDLPGILDYARQKNVGVWLWAHWTFVDTQMDEAFPLFEKWGIKGVKVDFMDRDDQAMIGFYHRVAAKAAQHMLMLDWHGAHKPTGLHKYYPNVLTHEAAMSQEYVKWSNRVTARHNTILPFTRGLAGPMDYTPGAMHNVSPSGFVPRFLNPAVPNTRAHQMGLYVVFENAFQMLCDYPEAYKGRKETGFMTAVPVTWDETRALMGHPGKFAVFARRKGDAWYIGGITNEDARELRVPLDFLPAGRYQAKLYTDGEQPDSTLLQSIPVSRASFLTLRLAEAGGFAGSITPVK